MSCELEAAQPEGVLYRLGRQPDPWAWPDWTYAGELGTFDNRYDDPRGEYRVLYASSERLARFLETLARFRRVRGRHPRPRMGTRPRPRPPGGEASK